MQREEVQEIRKSNAEKYYSDRKFKKVKNADKQRKKVLESRKCRDVSNKHGFRVNFPEINRGTDERTKREKVRELNMYRQTNKNTTRISFCKDRQTDRVRDSFETAAYVQTEKKLEFKKVAYFS